ncbi:MAG: hypothetical protein HUK22_06675, partial [Thermoguttaceae bacterium]|nr:hypothetical protein [Thermoguttaceae bacterium]
MQFTYQSYYDDYKNPEHAPAFLSGKAEADRLAERAVELTFAPAGIPKTGALDLLKSDPKVQGPKLFSQHCASCHNFNTDEAELADGYVPIVCAEPTAPNLYGAREAEWIRGFTSLETLANPDFFGNTAFAKVDENGKFVNPGSMVGFMTGRVAGGTEVDESGAFMVNPLGLIAKVIAADASPAFDILESVFEDFVAEDENVEILDKLIEEEDVEDAQAAYVAKLKELTEAKFADAEFVAELEPKLPAPVMAALKSTLIDMLSDDVYTELLFDTDNVELIKDEDAATFLTDAYLATLNGNEEPIASEDLKYIRNLRAGIVAACNGIADILAEEAKLDAPRPVVAQTDDGKDVYWNLAENAISDMEFLTCTECHAFYGSEEIDHACDLRGYMSREWLVGIISDPTLPKYYGE